MIRKPNPRRKKVKIKITSSGMLVSFGYNIRTPAVVELYPSQIAILSNTGMEYEIITPKSVKKVVTPVEVDVPKETDSVESSDVAVDVPKETDSVEPSDEVQVVREEEATAISIATSESDTTQEEPTLVSTASSESDTPQEESISKKKRKYRVKPIPFPDIVSNTSTDDVKSVEEASTESSIDNTELSF